MIITTYIQHNDAVERLNELIIADTIRALSTAEYAEYAELKKAIDKFNEIILNFD